MSAEARLVRGMAFYDAGQFSECIQAFGELLNDLGPGELDARQIERARVYFGACLIADDQPARADEQFRAAIRQNPQMAIPSTVVFPQAVVDRFILVRAALLDEIRRATREEARQATLAAERVRQRANEQKRHMEELERLARQERVVVRNERWMAWVPFGVGQFQNRDYALGGFFLATETAMLATAVTSVAIELSLMSQAGRVETGGAVQTSDSATASLNRNLSAAHVVSLAALGGLVVTAAVGVIEANVSFVPEFDGGRRRRPPGKKRIADDVSVEPTVVSVRSGAGLGLRGSF
jgi:hypothetical protein